MGATIRTRILILSDTHGHPIQAQDLPTELADVVIHCGDLTDGSKLSEFRDTIGMLKSLNAPLKLVIPGNHDFSLDETALKAKVEEAGLLNETELVVREYGSPEITQELFDDESTAAGIVLLNEGTHTFDLQNGGRLKVYASPYTPLYGGGWGFQDHPDAGHTFDIERDTDIVVTHGPPKGVLDVTYGGKRAGCPHLFETIARARPKLHCFGHMHAGWGAKLVRWKGSGTTGRAPTHFTAIDNENSKLIMRLADLSESALDSENCKVQKRARLQELAEQKCAVTSHCKLDEKPVRVGEETLFVNASIESAEEFVQRPWLVDIELPSWRTVG